MTTKFAWGQEGSFWELRAWLSPQNCVADLHNFVCVLTHIHDHDSN